MGDLAGLIRGERLALIDVLDSLTPDEWTVDSLCSGWTVQDVAAHLAWAPVLRPGEAALGFVRGGFRVNRMNADLARRWSARGREAILKQLRTNAAKGYRPPATPEAAALADAVCHSLDVRRPLGRTATLDPQAFRIVADFLADLRWPLTVTLGSGARTAVLGVRLVAADSTWSSGSGPDVSASGETLLLALAGRPVARAELSGPGADKLWAAGKYSVV